MSVILCSPVDCDSAGLSIKSWARKILANDVDGNKIVNLISASGLTGFDCDDRETWQSIFKLAIRFDDPCYQLAVTEVSGYDTIDCDDYLSPDSIAKRLAILDADGCLSLRVQIEAAADIACGEPISFYQLLRRALRTDGTNLAIAISENDFSDCDDDCDEPPFVMTKNTVFSLSSIDANLTVIRARTLTVIPAGDFLLLESGDFLLLESGDKIELE